MISGPQFILILAMIQQNKKQKLGNQLMQCSAVEGECSVTCCSENALAFKRFRGLSSMANVCALVLMWN